MGRPRSAPSQATPDETRAEGWTTISNDLVSLHVRLSPDLEARVRMHAAATRRTPSEIVSDAVSRNVPEYEPKST